MIEFLDWLSGALWGRPLIYLVAFTGIYFTVRSGFFQFTHFGYMLKRTIGTLFTKKKDLAADGSAQGMISAFEAVSTAIGGTVGYGNIAGVATAVAAGGPGAVFWMWATALLGMIIKQVEVTLGCYYRGVNDDGGFYGGPTFYMQKGLGEDMKWGKLWLIPAVIFSVGIFSTHFVTSSSITPSQIVAGAFHFEDGITIGGYKFEGVIVAGFFICLVTYYITAGGTKRIASLFSKMVPIMSVAYMFLGLAMILVNATEVPAAFASIFTNAFTGTAAVGGFAGAAVSRIIQVGMSRAVYSNEAGEGTSAMIHSSSKTRHPVEQGLWGGFEVFFDTIVVCTITAISVILSGHWTDGTNGGTLAQSAFSSSLGMAGSVVLSVIMVVFAITTTGGWFTYYLAILEHIFFKGDSLAKKLVMKFFVATRALPGFLWAIYLVKTNNQGFIWTIVDITSAIPTFANCFVILVLSGKYISLLKDYKARYLGVGKVDENMKIFYEDAKRAKEAQ